MRLFLLILALVAFTLFSVYLVSAEGYFGFIHLALRERWAAQMLLDLVIALSLFSGWMVRDARARGLPFAPYFLLTVTLGSIGALAYLVHREIRARRGALP